MRAAAGLALAFALLLAGCGFQLRGSDAGRGPAAVVIDDTAARASATASWLGGGPAELARLFTEIFDAGDVTVQEDAPVRVELVSERIEKRVASVDATASAAEYRLDYTLLFRVRGADGATLVPETRLRLDRSYRHKPDAIMGAAEEEALLQRDLRRDAAWQVLRRLRQLPASAGAVPTGTSPASSPDSAAGTTGQPADAPRP